MMRIWPRSLAGQMALLVAIGLFVAQAINFGLLLRERRSLLLEQVTGPAIARLNDAIERTANGRGPVADRGRVRRMAFNPIGPAMAPEPTVEAAIRAGLAEAGHTPLRIVTGVRPPRPEVENRRGQPPRRWRAELVIAVEQPGRGWLVTRSGWPHDTMYLVWRLIFQTLILYGIILLPVLWIGRRISRPLRDLTRAAEGFDPRIEGPPVPEQGPLDVSALIAAFNALRLRVAAMLDEKDRMLGAIGHDLRTPLAALRVRIESVEDDGDRARMADTISEMNRMLDDILSLARMGRPSEPATEVDLAALVDAVVEDFRDLGQDVSFAETPRLRLRLRPSLMRRAVRNLIENAVKYGEAADVRIDAQGQRIAIHVIDCGPGIPPDRLGDVFDPFTRLETSRNRETGGIGLGLALARSIVRDAGGEITLANRPEGGLCATITLAAARAASPSPLPR
ncbi:sensor histidine kinase [Sphingomonas carotinifaciens]|uniref:histidine kinase n=2 Tax=Sphingomonas carotinifaciens TaxID=1166323 RepID=A0A1G7QLB4_9SPHN|nr:HAMP domain-containing sensor histidine kinase [Sphingomonas carotinifaciens]MBB4087642.1 signal transduction histidine kinase [Sphingomonas carotinifaciens]SDF99341.1 Signal transduction histidine kinase [Sphingomonas carotinifaciens]